MARKATRRTVGATTASNNPYLTHHDVERELTVRILRRLRTMLMEDQIVQYNTWAQQVAESLSMSRDVVVGLVEPTVLVTVGKYFGIEKIPDLKNLFNVVTGTMGEGARTMGLKIVNDTVTRLEKKIMIA